MRPIKARYLGRAHNSYPVEYVFDARPVRQPARIGAKHLAALVYFLSFFLFWLGVFCNPAPWAVPLSQAMILPNIASALYLWPRPK